MKPVPAERARPRAGETKRDAARRVAHSLHPVPLPPGLPLRDAIKAADEEIMRNAETLLKELREVSDGTTFRRALTKALRRRLFPDATEPDGVG